MLDPADFTDGGTARDAYLPLVLDPNTRHASTNDHSPPSHDTSDGNDHPSSCDVHGDGATSHALMGAATAVRTDVPFGSLASDASLCASSARIETPSGAMHAHDSCMMHSEHTECSGANALIHAIGLAPQSARAPSISGEAFDFSGVVRDSSRSANELLADVFPTCDDMGIPPCAPSPSQQRESAAPKPSSVSTTEMVLNPSPSQLFGAQVGDSVDTLMAQFNCQSTPEFVSTEYNLSAQRALVSAQSRAAAAESRVQLLEAELKGQGLPSASPLSANLPVAQGGALPEIVVQSTPATHLSTAQFFAAQQQRNAALQAQLSAERVRVDALLAERQDMLLKSLQTGQGACKSAAQCAPSSASFVSPVSFPPLPGSSACASVPSVTRSHVTRHSHTGQWPLALKPLLVK